MKKNHYYVIQIGNMIAQIIEGWETLWKKVKTEQDAKAPAPAQCVEKQ